MIKLFFHSMDYYVSSLFAFSYWPGRGKPLAQEDWKRRVFQIPSFSPGTMLIFDKQVSGSPVARSTSTVPSSSIHVPSVEAQRICKICKSNNAFNRHKLIDCSTCSLNVHVTCLPDYNPNASTAVTQCDTCARSSPKLKKPQAGKPSSGAVAPSSVPSTSPKADHPSASASTPSLTLDAAYYSKMESRDKVPTRKQSSSDERAANGRYGSRAPVVATPRNHGAEESARPPPPNVAEIKKPSPPVVFEPAPTGPPRSYPKSPKRRPRSESDSSSGRSKRKPPRSKSPHGSEAERRAIEQFETEKLSTLVRKLSTANSNEPAPETLQRHSPRLPPVFGWPAIHGGSHCHRDLDCLTKSHVQGQSALQRACIFSLWPASRHLSRLACVDPKISDAARKLLHVGGAWPAVPRGIVSGSWEVLTRQDWRDFEIQSAEHFALVRDGPRGGVVMSTVQTHDYLRVARLQPHYDM